jgi:hypothetical protein
LPGKRVGGAGYLFLALWAAGLLLYAIGGYFGVRTLHGYRAETEKFRQTSLESRTIEPGTNEPEMKASKKPVKVMVGIYVNRIGEFDAKEGGWTADFDIWFRWTDARIRPGETFQLVNGEIHQREKKETYARGRERYERYRVKARITKFFDASRFPFGDEVLTMQVEDGAPGEANLQYVAATSLSSSIREVSLSAKPVIFWNLSTMQHCKSTDRTLGFGLFFILKPFGRKTFWLEMVVPAFSIIG